MSLLVDTPMRPGGPADEVSPQSGVHASAATQATWAGWTLRDKTVCNVDESKPTRDPTREPTLVGCSIWPTHAAVTPTAARSFQYRCPLAWGQCGEGHRRSDRRL